jgi:hypothetical protein
MAIVGSVDQLKFRDNVYEIVPEIAPLFQDTASYNSGDWVIYEACMYEFKTSKSAGAWDATKVNGPFTVTGQLSDLKSGLSDLELRVEILEKGGGGETWTNADEVNY